MASARKHPKLQSVNSRSKLSIGNRYWVNICEGIALGYRKGPRGGSWHGRVYKESKKRKYEFKRLGSADDNVEANGQTILTFYQAQEKARHWAADELRRRGIGKIHDATVSDAAELYLEWYAHHRKAYRETEHSIRTHILPAFGEIKLVDMKAGDIRAWHENLATSPARTRSGVGQEQRYRGKPKTEDEKRKRRATANRILTVLKAILNRAVEKELISDDREWKSVKPFKQADEPVIRFLTEAEATRLVNVSEPDFRRLVKAALFTGARYGELSSLLVRDFSPDISSVYIRQSKSGRARHVPLSAEGHRFFEEISAGKLTGEPLLTKSNGAHWGKNHHTRAHFAACERAKIAPPFRFNDLRHTYASTLAQRGVDLLTISKLLGHRDTRITSRHYAHLADQTLRDAVAKLPAFGHQRETNVASIA